MSSNDLRRCLGLEMPTTPAPSRNVGRRVQAVYDDVHYAGVKIDGAYALAGHAMEGAIGLDNWRRALAHGDPAQSAILLDIERTALAQAHRIQANLYNRWQ
jgi:hypothetical protein